jgi:transposase
MAPVVEAYQDAWRLVSRRYDFCRRDWRRAPIRYANTADSFPPSCPAESSTGDTVRRKRLTLAGNRRARRALVEAVWTYRYPARVSEPLRTGLEGLPKPVRDIAWKAQIRLRARCRRLSATGKKLPVVVAAIAREMAAFLWAIGRGGRAGVRAAVPSSLCSQSRWSTKGGELQSLVTWPGSRPTPVL